MSKLILFPCGRDEANAYVEQHHRHHGRVVGHKYAIGCASVDGVHGVIIVGRPVARALDDGWSAEALRCCTDGTPNVASKLYAAAWRAARAMGYLKLITYTLPQEGGASLRAAGFTVVGRTTNTRGWDCATRPRIDTHPLQAKLRWELHDSHLESMPLRSAPAD